MSYDVIDPLAELERLIAECTCEWCDRTYHTALSRTWCSWTQQKNGYTVKHERNWRVCEYCLSGVKAFGKWILPVVRHVPEMGLDMAMMLSVQPMTRAMPNAVDLRMEILKNRTDGDGAALALNFRLDYKLNQDRTVEKTVRTPLGQTTQVIKLDDP